MRLMEWQSRNPTVKVLCHDGMARVFEPVPRCEDWTQLWHLSDYVVAGMISGPSVALVSRDEEGR